MYKHLKTKNAPDEEAAAITHAIFPNVAPNDEWYTMSGQRVGETAVAGLSKGIYICNGKKILMR